MPKSQAMWVSSVLILGFPGIFEWKRIVRNERIASVMKDK
jgi:hypothetical protein